MKAADATLMTDINDLEPLSKRLNTASNDLNVSLQIIQERLNALGIGLEVWLKQSSLSETSWEDIGTGKREYMAEELGYGRLDEGWGLLVRTNRYTEDTDGNTESYPSPPKSLLRASRALRVASIPLIPALIDKIKIEAEHTIAIVEQAKTIAKSIGMAYVHVPLDTATPGTELTIDVEGEMSRTTVVPLPFKG
jgi:Glycine cleavage T-protein C-terminal barrel domain